MFLVQFIGQIVFFCLGKFFVQNDEYKMLDKLLNWWYNRNAGRWVRRRHAQKKRPMGLFIPQVIGPLVIEEGFGAVPVLFKGLLVGVIANLIHVEHCCIPLPFICLYYNTRKGFCQALFTKNS